MLTQAHFGTIVLSSPFGRQEWRDVGWKGEEDGKLEHTSPAISLIVVLVKRHKVYHRSFILQRSRAKRTIDKSTQNLLESDSRHQFSEIWVVLDSAGCSDLAGTSALG